MPEAGSRGALVAGALALAVYFISTRRAKQCQQEQQASQRKKQNTHHIRPKSLPIKRNPPKRASRPSLLSRSRGLPTNTANRNRIQSRQENFKRRLSLQPKTQSIPKAQSTPKCEPEPQKSLEGLMLKDLATVLQKSESEVRGMIEDLQLEGKIYQNERGEYLPL